LAPVTEFKLARAGDVALVTIDNGEDWTKPTFFGEQALESLDRLLGELEGSDYRAAVITGKPFFFAAGADITEFPDITRDRAIEGARAGHELFGRLRALPFPTVAAINGACLGGGVELALHCTARTVSTAVRHFAFPEVFLGLFPAWGGTQLLPRLVGPETAIKVIVSNPLRQNRMLTGSQVAELGIADRLFKPVEFVDESLAFARELAAQPLERPAPDWSEAETLFRRARTDVDDTVHGAAPAPYTALDLIEGAGTWTVEEGYSRERDAIGELLPGPQAQASIYAFGLVEQRAKKHPARPTVAPVRVAKVGIVGAGLMARQIATLFLRRLEVPIVIRDVKQEIVDEALSNIDEPSAIVVESRHRQVLRHRQVGRAWATGDRSPNGVADDARDIGDRGQLRGVRGEPADRRRLVDLLERLAATVRALDLADDREHRGRILPGGVDPDGEVGRADRPGPEAHRRSPGQLPVGLGHERRGAFVARRHDADAGAFERVEQAQKGLAGHGEGIPDAGRAEGVGDEPADGPRAGVDDRFEVGRSHGVGRSGGVGRRLDTRVRLGGHGLGVVVCRVGRRHVVDGFDGLLGNGGHRLRRLPGLDSRVDGVSRGLGRLGRLGRRGFGCGCDGVDLGGRLISACGVELGHDDSAPSIGRPSRGGRSAVVLELERDCQIELAQSGDDALEVVAALAGHADGVTLDLRLDLRELVPDQLGDLLGDLLRQASSEADPLADLVAARFLHLAPVEDLERQASPDRLRLDEVLDRGRPILVVGDQDELILGLGQVHRHALEVEPRTDLSTDLIERVPKLLLVEVAHDVE
jgi:enoyl-CoA hydratase/carnithine racemase